MNAQNEQMFDAEELISSIKQKFKFKSKLRKIYYASKI